MDFARKKLDDLCFEQNGYKISQGIHVRDRSDEQVTCQEFLILYLYIIIKVCVYIYAIIL